MPHTKSEVLVASARGLAIFETVRKSVEENIYERSKGCPKHWTVLCFVIELLILKAKHGWSDGSFNDLLRIMAWLLPKPNKGPANTHTEQRSLSARSPWVWKESMHVQIIVYCNMGLLLKT